MSKFQGMISSLCPSHITAGDGLQKAEEAEKRRRRMWWK